MMKDAPVIFLDEATANVDPENENELTKAIEALTREKTVIMIAHRLKTVEHADQILVVDHGRIVQRGPHEQLMLWASSKTAAGIACPAAAGRSTPTNARRLRRLHDLKSANQSINGCLRLVVRCRS